MGSDLLTRNTSTKVLTGLRVSTTKCQLATCWQISYRHFFIFLCNLSTRNDAGLSAGGRLVLASLGARFARKPLLVRLFSTVGHCTLSKRRFNIVLTSFRQLSFDTSHIRHFVILKKILKMCHKHHSDNFSTHRNLDNHTAPSFFTCQLPYSNYNEMSIANIAFEQNLPN